MKIAIDARSLTARPTGVGHYLMAVVNVWSERRPDIEFVLMAHKPLHAQAAQALRQAPNVRFDYCPCSLMPTNGLWWLMHGWVLRARAVGATHLWAASGVLPPAGTAGLPTLLTVHDLVYRSMPWTMSTRTRIAYSLLAGRSIRRADFVWAISRFTAQEIERHYPQRRARDMVIGCGLNPLRASMSFTREQLDDVARRYEINERTLLFVGTLEPRKNLAFLLSLMPELARRGYRLLVAGCAGWGRSNLAGVVQAPGFPREAVRFCDYVSDADLQAMYQCVAFYISTALMEGFGLPHLEAMTAGCPVIAAANSAVVEVVSDGGCLVEGWDTGRWVQAIEQAFAQRHALQAAARHNAERHASSIAQACEAISRSLPQPV